MNVTMVNKPSYGPRKASGPVCYLGLLFLHPFGWNRCLRDHCIFLFTSIALRSKPVSIMSDNLHSSPFDWDTYVASPEPLETTNDNLNHGSSTHANDAASFTDIQQYEASALQHRDSVNRILQPPPFGQGSDIVPITEIGNSFPQHQNEEHANVDTQSIDDNEYLLSDEEVQAALANDAPLIDFGDQTSAGLSAPAIQQPFDLLPHPAAAGYYSMQQQPPNPVLVNLQQSAVAIPASSSSYLPVIGQNGTAGAW
jgi:hypothetical protein